MLRLICLLFFLSPILAFAEKSDNKEFISVYSYHLKPPLIVDDSNGEGLYFDLINYLNSASSLYRFNLVYVPRKRIEKMLNEQTLDGLLLGVNPVWFKDKSETKYFWTPRIFTDRDELVSLKSTSFEFINPSSLQDKIFGGVRGFYYYGINEFIKTNKALRVDTVQEIDLFSMLLNKRVDTAVISRSTYDYMLSINEWHGQFHLSKKPHDIYDRRILIPHNLEEVYQHINPLIEFLQFDNQWKVTLEKYK